MIGKRSGSYQRFYASSLLRVFWPLWRGPGYGMIDIPFLHCMGLDDGSDAAAERLEVYNDVKSFYWNCAKAFPILILVPWLSSAVSTAFESATAIFH